MCSPKKNQTLHKFCPDFKLVLSVPRLRMVLKPGAILPSFDKISKASGFKFQTPSKDISTQMYVSIPGNPCIHHTIREYIPHANCQLFFGLQCTDSHRLCYNFFSFHFSNHLHIHTILSFHILSGPGPRNDHHHHYNYHHYYHHHPHDHHHKKLTQF